ncbi:hypothetical protein ACFQAT_05910 [Undibacterium arcticum]|uniref:Uncharacterized protein n=1 Tax=Undibacterium arcticum TaxID=1762892 RepID=A0ABV7F7V4_9BURK
MTHPAKDPKLEHQRDTDGQPKFGRLLIVLLLAVMLVVAVTFGSQAYFS